MVRLVTKAPEPGMVQPGTGPQGIPNTAIGEGLTDAAAIMSRALSSQPDPVSMSRFQQDIDQRRATAQFAVEQIDIATQGLNEAGLQSVAEASLESAKLNSLRLQNPATTKDSLRRIAHVRRSIANNPLAAPELLQAFGMVNDESVGGQLEDLFSAVDRQNNERRQAIDTYRNKYGLWDQSDEFVARRLNADAELARDAQNTAYEWQIMDNDMNLLMGDLEFDRRNSSKYLEVLQNKGATDLLQRRADFFQNRISYQANTQAIRMAEEFMANYDPAQPIEGQANAFIAQMEMMAQNFDETARDALGWRADENLVQAQGSGIRGVITLMEKFAKQEISATAMKNAVSELQNGVRLRLYQQSPEYLRSVTMLSDLQPIFESNFADLNTLRPLMQSLQGALAKIGEQTAVSGGTIPEGGPADLVSLVETQGKTRREAITALRRQSSVLSDWADQKLTPQNKGEFQSILRATLNSANPQSKLLSEEQLIESMDALLPVLNNPKAVELIPEDLVDQFALNFQVYTQHMAQSMAGDLSNILGTKVNVQQIPRLLGMANEVIPELRDFIDVSATVEGVSQTPNYSMKVTDNGNVVLMKDGRSIPLRSQSALNMVDTRAAEWLNTWNSTYRPKLKLIANFYADNMPGDYTPGEIAQMLIAGQTPLTAPPKQKEKPATE